MIKRSGIIILILCLLTGCGPLSKNDNQFLYGQGQGKNGVIEVELYIQNDNL